jgi:hypothetical protein
MGLPLREKGLYETHLYERTKMCRSSFSVITSHITESSEMRGRAHLRLQHNKDARGSDASPITFKLETCYHSQITTKSETGVVAACLRCHFWKNKKKVKRCRCCATSRHCRRHRGGERWHRAPPTCRRRGGGRRHRAPTRCLDSHLTLSAFTHFTPPAPATMSKGRHPATRSPCMASWRRGRRRGA